MEASRVKLMQVTLEHPTRRDRAHSERPRGVGNGGGLLNRFLPLSGLGSPCFPLPFLAPQEKERENGLSVFISSFKYSGLKRPRGFRIRKIRVPMLDPSLVGLTVGQIGPSKYILCFKIRVLCFPVRWP